MTNYTDFRIAWLRPGPRFNEVGKLLYWEPLFKEFQRVFPKVVFFATGRIRPYYKNMFRVHSVGQLGWKRISVSETGSYDRGIHLLSPAIVLKLLKLKPRVIISSEFNLWTILAALFKFIGSWKLVVLYEGYAPTHGFNDAPVRLLTRKWIARRADVFITNSLKGKNYLQNILEIPKERVFRIIHEISDINALLKEANTSLPIQQGKRPRFLCVGHLIPRKGINYLLDAWSKLRSLYSNFASLWIVGDGPQRDELMQKAHNLGLKEVHFIGKVGNGSLGWWYQSCDIFVFPTLEDAWGVVTMEAMSFGKPILCSKYAGAAELVRDSENGFIIEPRDTEGLARLMLKFINSPDLIEKFGEKSKEIMKPHTHVNAVAGFREVIKHHINLRGIKSGNEQTV